MAKRTFLTLVADNERATAQTGEAGSRTLIERAYAQLRDDIIEGRLGPDPLQREHAGRAPSPSGVRGSR